MVYAPFGPSKRWWNKRAHYHKELQEFMKAHKDLPLQEVYRLWFSRPEHMGRKGFQRLMQKLLEKERRRRPK